MKRWLFLLAPLFALSAAVAAFPQALGVLARAMNEPRSILWSNGAAALWSLTLGIPLVESEGVRGAILAMGGGGLVEGIVLLLLLRRAHRVAVD